MNTAYHEAGHTLTSVLTLNANPVHKVTIQPRGNALGYTNLINQEEFQINAAQIKA